MAGRKYDFLSIEEFGTHLLDTGDLDPVYIVLTTMGMDPEQRKRWLMAYWCFYSCGFASWASERTGQDFWDAMFQAGRNEEPTPFGERWPRGHERRHFRGAQAERGLQGLYDRYGSHPEGMVDFIVGDGQGLTQHVITKRVREHKQFGPWIGFKVSDMVDRVLGVFVEFDERGVFMFKDPYNAALMLWRQRIGETVLEGAEAVVPNSDHTAVESSVDYLRSVFGQRSAPPFNDRFIGLQEIETILCKWKSHLHGHYPLFNDTHEILDGLAPWKAHSETATRFAEAMPTQGE